MNKKFNINFLIFPMVILVFILTLLFIQKNVDIEDYDIVKEETIVIDIVDVSSSKYHIYCIVKTEIGNLMMINKNCNVQKGDIIYKEDDKTSGYYGQWVKS